jgi:hypothetical protein
LKYLIKGENIVENGLLGQKLEKEKAFRYGLMIHSMKAGG